MAFCRMCGSPVAEGAKFCQKCGTKIQLSEEVIENEKIPDTAKQLGEEAVPETAKTEKKKNRSKKSMQRFILAGASAMLLLVAIIICAMLHEPEANLRFKDLHEILSMQYAEDIAYYMMENSTEDSYNRRYDQDTFWSASYSEVILDGLEYSGYVSSFENHLSHYYLTYKTENKKEYKKFIDEFIEYYGDDYNDVSDHLREIVEEYDEKVICAYEWEMAGLGIELQVTKKGNIFNEEYDITISCL